MRRETNQVLQLTPCLFNNSILTSQDDAHSTQIANFSPAHDQRVDVKSASCKGTRDTRQDSRFILNKAIKNMSVRGNAGCTALNIFAMSHASFHGTHFLYGCKLGGGVLYKIFVTASSALRSRAISVAGNGGGGLRCCCLYAKAEVESSAVLGGLLEFASAWLLDEEEAERAIRW